MSHLSELLAFLDSEALECLLSLAGKKRPRDEEVVEIDNFDDAKKKRHMHIFYSKLRYN